MRYAADDQSQSQSQSQSQERHLIRCLKGNIIKRLRETYVMINIERD